MDQETGFQVPGLWIVWLAGLLLLSVPEAYAQQGSGVSYREPYRPAYHFSPPRNWTNDPNGLVYCKGEYHLFYQYNPDGILWGHMSWGHAESTDLFHWKTLPLAIPEDSSGMIFSGSAVYDSLNTSGLGARGQRPLVAIYTRHQLQESAPGQYIQSQNLAYSQDQGIHWIKYPGNPVLDLHHRDFRDPKVSWYAPRKEWIMVVSRASHKKVQFYRSSNLKQWSYQGSFGLQGDTSQVWECPDLFRLPVTNEPGIYKWVLMVSVQYRVQYFIGSFNGKVFHNDNTRGKILWVDQGTDFYAATTFNDIPAGDGRRICLAWMNNWSYARELPTYPWKGSMTLPRSFSLERTEAGIRLIQHPVREIRGILAARTTLKDLQVPADSRKAILNYPLNSGSISLLIDGGKATKYGVEVLQKGKQGVLIGYDRIRAKLFIDRSHSGETGFDRKFATVIEVPLKVKGQLRLSIYLDHGSVEVFEGRGSLAITTLVFPASDQNGICLFARGAPVRVSRLVLSRFHPCFP